MLRPERSDGQLVVGTQLKCPKVLRSHGLCPHFFGGQQVNKEKQCGNAWEDMTDTALLSHGCHVSSCPQHLFPMNTQEVVGGGGVQGRGTVGDCEPKQ